MRERVLGGGGERPRPRPTLAAFLTILFPFADCDKVAANYASPNAGKPFDVPADRAGWSLPSGQCGKASDEDAAGVHELKMVNQAGWPDIMPAKFAPLPAKFAAACDWIKVASSASNSPATLDAVYEHGIASGEGWADANGYCA